MLRGDVELLNYFNDKIMSRFEGYIIKNELQQASSSVSVAGKSSLQQRFRDSYHQG